MTQFYPCDSCWINAGNLNGFSILLGCFGAWCCKGKQMEAHDPNCCYCFELSGIGCNFCCLGFVCCHPPWFQTYWSKYNPNIINNVQPHNNNNLNINPQNQGGFGYNGGPINNQQNSVHHNSGHHNPEHKHQSPRHHKKHFLKEGNPGTEQEEVGQDIQLNTGNELNKEGDGKVL